MKKLMALAAAAVLAMVSGHAGAATDDKNRVVIIENISGKSLFAFFASPVSESNWQEDLLGEHVFLSRGQSVTANIDKGTNDCHYDLKAVMEDGREVIRNNVDVCTVSKWTIGDSGDSIG